MDYTSEIQNRLSMQLAGLKKGRGLAWLNAALNELNDAGLKQIVKEFRDHMHDPGEVGGWFLEIKCALAALHAYPTITPRENCQDGSARSPCDITVQTSSFRADFQCKSIQNYDNALFVEEFLAWAEQSYPDMCQGRHENAQIAEVKMLTA